MSEKSAPTLNLPPVAAVHPNGRLACLLYPVSPLNLGPICPAERVTFELNEL
jgi:hypothetical protein